MTKRKCNSSKNKGNKNLENLTRIVKDNFDPLAATLSINFFGPRAGLPCDKYLINYYSL
ncbi:MAG: hypothetical protein HeimC2_40040 [Candidatus Heimdallarchaeota archaeon LC_2]|nr:MAG: hypothetical protein HeimC2_40040 [Candidatus Heimdallarchaeota archaeon LC_2]